MLHSRLSPLVAALIALAVGACANSGTPNLFGSGQARPKTVIVSDFVAASEVTATDNGFNTRLERRGGNFPILERRQRTLARVNDEIVATIVADVLAAGLDARPGNETSLSFGEDVVLVGGRLRAPEEKPVAQVGFGPGRGNVVADMTLTRTSAVGRTSLLTFSADAQAGRKVATGNAQALAARNAAIAAALAAENALPEKLSPDVEAQARGLGRAIAERIVAYAKEHEWLIKPETAEASSATPAAEQRVRLPDAKPAVKPAAAKPAVRKPPGGADAPEDEEPPDTDVPDQPR